MLGGLGRQGIGNGTGILRDFEEGVTGVGVGHVASERYLCKLSDLFFCHIARFRRKGHMRDMMKALSCELCDLERSA